MPFQVIWSKRAKKDLKNFERQIAERIIQKVSTLEETEFPFLEKVKGKDFYKFRVGKYGVFIDKIQSKRLLLVITIRRRKKAYKLF